MRKERLGELLVYQFVDVSLRLEESKLLAAVMGDAWHEREQSAKAVESSLRAEIDELDQRRNRLVDAYLKERGISESPLDSQMKRDDAQEDEVRGRLEAHQYEGMDLSKAVGITQSMLQDLAGLWNHLDP